MHISLNAFIEAFGGDPSKAVDAEVLNKAKRSYNEIAVLVGGDPVSGGAVHEGGISLSGVFDDDNPSFSKDEKARIKKLIAPLKLDKEPAPAQQGGAN